ncbi:hypothetical protein B4129_0668 [Bacillus safensis]|nr:hypothetical protein B4129_0668 [Bacillus safensis]
MWNEKRGADPQHLLFSLESSMINYRYKRSIIDRKELPHEIF